MRHYWQILKKYKLSILFSPLLVLAGVTCETLQPKFMAKIVDEGVMLHDLQVISTTGVTMVAVSILGLLSSIINVFLSTRTSIGFGSDLRTVLFQKIQQFSFSDIDRFNSASLITRLTNDISKIQHIILMSMRIMLRSPMMLLMAIFFIFSINTELALILTASIPVLIIFAYIIARRGFPLFLKVQQAVDRLNGVVRENLINIRVVKSFVREEFEVRKFTKSSEELQDISIKASNTIIIMFPLMQLVMNISVIAILWFGGRKVMTGEIKVGELISFVNYLFQIMMSLMMFSMIIMNLARASASSERVTEVLNTEPSLINTPEGGLNRHQISRGEITFKQVSFRYTGGKNDVLKELSFHIRQGETIAVVGATGSAKTSMVQLIPRLYDVTSGEVLIDGVNVKDYHPDELHREIGMVLQKNELFSGTILENLRWGKMDATLEEVVKAAKTAQAHEFITSFTNGYDTLLERGGVNLSGGQRQRLCIARALLREPKILILDDSTSAVDSETEQKIHSALEKQWNDTTVIIITQRVHAMQMADRVIVLENGELEAIGKPADLLEQSESYREICHSQQVAF